jgi:dephospho-CoA kinase
MMQVRSQILKLGVTGGIGSGKTSVCRVFSVLGVPVFSADPVAKKIMDYDKDIINKINTVAGKDLYREGTLDRRELAKLIFNDQKLLRKVNSIVHPVVFEHFKLWVSEQTAPYVIMEAAILFESSASKLVDRIATVVAPIDERVQRVTRGKHLTRDQVMERIRNQIDDDIRIRKSNYVIYNSENDMIIPAILVIHDDMMKRINIK